MASFPVESFSSSAALALKHAMLVGVIAQAAWNATKPVPMASESE